MLAGYSRKVFEKVRSDEGMLEAFGFSKYAILLRAGMVGSIEAD